jgi:DNA-binding CsgD family transcriptional regulator
MVRLSEADFRGVLGFLHEAGEVDGPDAFPEPLPGLLASQLRADTLWHSTVRGAGDPFANCTVHHDRIEVRWGWGAGAVEGELPGDVLEALRAYPHEDPVPAEATSVNRPVRRSDRVSTREWRKRGRWADVDRRVGAEDWARLWVGSPEGPLGVFEADTCHGEWGDRVVVLLELLAPHLAQLMRRAELRAEAHPHPSGLTPRELEILALVAEGRTNDEIARMLWISANTVRKHLENTFEKLDVHTRTAAVARAFGTS